MSETGNRIRGTLFGLAAGDKIGGPIAMALCLGESLAQHGTFDPDDILKRYLEQWPQFAFDSGPISKHVFALITQGVPAREAVRQAHIVLDRKTAGCNPAHRIAPTAMAAFLPDDMLGNVAHQESALTHWDIVAGDVSTLVAVLCRALIKGTNWFQSVEQLLPKSISVALRQNPEQLLDRGGFAPVVLSSAVYFVNKHLSFEDALKEAIEFAGPVNYCPVLVGAFAGARWGSQSIPDDALNHCRQHHERLAYVSESLVQTWKS